MEPDIAECPSCGLVLAKWRARESSRAPEPASETPKASSTGRTATLALVALALAGWLIMGMKDGPVQGLFAAAATREEDSAPAEEYADWYPQDVSPPPGTQYPCALTALPKELPGIPPSHRRYINHSYTLILKSTQQKLIVYNGLGEEPPPQGTLDDYLTETRALKEKLLAEPTPKSLEAFRTEVAEAMELQMAFFTKAYAQRRSGQTFEQVIGIAEGRQASAKLQSAWGIMSARYPSWSEATKDSIYHHLCALDLF